MKIIPAIDLLDGKCVRLLKGNYQDVSEYNSSPLNQINIFLDAGFDYVHIVDLDAARSGPRRREKRRARAAGRRRAGAGAGCS